MKNIKYLLLIVLIAISFNTLEAQSRKEKGLFKLKFAVPKDISYQIDYGKISLYAKETNLTTDASGYNNQILNYQHYFLPK